MVRCNYIFSFLVLTLGCLVAVSYGSIREGRTFRLTNEKTDPTEFESKFRRGFLRHANEPRYPPGVITRHGSLAFDSDHREANQITGLDCEYSLQHLKLASECLAVPPLTCFCYLSLAPVN